MLLKLDPQTLLRIDPQVLLEIVSQTLLKISFTSVIKLTDQDDTIKTLNKTKQNYAEKTQVNLKRILLSI